MKVSLSRFASFNFFAFHIFYRLEWRDLVLLASEPDLKKLKHMAVTGELKVSKFRSV